MSEPSAHQRPWLSAAEVADLFGMTPRTVGAWIDQGHLPGYRLPGKRSARRVLRVKLLEFVRQRPEFSFVEDLLYGRPIQAGSSRERYANYLRLRAAAAQGRPAEDRPEEGTGDQCGAESREG